LPDFDQRAAKAVRVEPAQQQAKELLASRVAGLRVEWDRLLASPRWVYSRHGLLGGLNGRGAVSAAALRLFSPGDTNRVLKAFVREHAALFGHGDEVLESALLKRSFVTAHNGLRTMVWEQQHLGIPVYEAVLISHLTKRGELVSVSSRFVPAPAAAAQAGKGVGEGGLAGPVIPAAEAVRLAAKDLGAELASEDIVALDGYAAGPEQGQRFKAPLLRGPTRVSLVWLPLNRNTLQLCWKVELAARGRAELYRSLIDAQTGQVRLRRSLTRYLSNATYRVFTGDSPTPYSPGYPAPSGAQPPAVERQLVSLGALSTNASPNGWINAADNETQGNNVDAHTDRNNDDTPDLPRPHGATGRVFDFALDLTKAPTTYSQAAVVQLFYWNNWMHDRLYELGFTEAAGNFQNDNFGRGGRDGDAVQADAQDGGGFNNANFYAGDDGTPGRMQMYLFDGPSPDRDGDLDAEIVLHEYTHGLSERRVGGGVGLSEMQSGGLGEGWSDFYALALLSEPSDDFDGTYPDGAYAAYRLGDPNFTDNYYFGIRRYPYCTDLNKNPLSFKDIDPTQASTHPGIPLSPLYSSADPEEVHNQGEVWCVMLWEARANLVRKWGWERGNQLVLQLVTDGMNLAPPNPNFAEARDAILQADQLNQNGANRAELWAAFAKRGLGFSAIAPSSDTTRGVEESYDMPDDLLVAERGGLVANGPEGGPFVPSSLTYTLSNVGTNAVEWSALWTEAWLGVAPASGRLAVGGAPASATVSLDPSVYNLPAGVYRDALIFTNHVSGRAQTRQMVLRIGQPDFFTEVFGPDKPPLNNQSITFVPDNSASGYWLYREAAAEFPTDPSNGTPLELEDDGFAQIELADQQSVALYGVSYTNVFVSANGYLTFTAGFSDYDDQLPVHFSVPRVSVLFRDFDPSAGGSVSWKQLPDRLAVTYENVPEFYEVNQSTFQVELFFNGRIRFTWLEVEAAGGIVGLSKGGGVPADFAQSDFAAVPGPLPLLQVSLPPSATEGDGALSGSVAIPDPSSLALEVQLGSVNTAALSVPASVTIPAGQTTASFAATVLENAIVDGTRVARVTATAPGYAPGSARVFIYDNEAATLTVELPDTAKEGDGMVTGWVGVSPAPAQPVTVRLAVSDTNEVVAPPFVVVPAGPAGARFDLTIVDDNRIDGPRPATVTATVANWVEGSDTIVVEDNESRDLRVEVRLRVGEGAGRVSNSGSVRLAGTLATNLTVALRSSDPTALSVPAEVTILAGQTAAPFDLTVLDDDVVDGEQAVSLTATAPGFGDGSGRVLITDDETPPVPSGPVPAHLSTNNPPYINLAWATGQGEAIVNGDFESGDFRGWVAESTTWGSWVINDGTFDPESPDGPLPPFAGRYSALTRQIGAGKRVLYQEVTIPAGVPMAVLRWADRIRNHASLFVEPGQEFRVEIQNQAGDTLARAFSTEPGDTLLNDWVERSFDLGDFIGQTVRIAFVEEDSLSYLNVHLDQVSVFFGQGRPTSYAVYFGVKPALGEADQLGSTETNRWDLPDLPIDATYYWQVVARRGAAQTPGPVWQFGVPGVGPVDHFVWRNVVSPQFVNEPFPVSLLAKDRFNNTATNFSGAVGLSGRIEYPETTIGKDDLPWEYPMGTYYEDSRLQVIYLPAEAGPARRLTALALNVTTAPALTLNRWTIRLKHTGLRSYGANPLWERTGWTTVYQKNETVSEAGWATFQFATPFEYDGVSGLMVDLSFNNSSYMMDGECMAFTTAQPRAISYSSDSLDGDPLTWSGSYPPPRLQLQAPQLRLYSVIPVSVTPALSGEFQNGVWQGEITVAELAEGMSLRATDEEGHWGGGNEFSVGARNDLALEVIDAPDPITVGQPLFYTVTVYNSGPAEATGVVLSNRLPANVTFLAAEASQGACTNLDNVVWCELGTLPGGNNATVRITVQPTVPGGLTNRFTVARLEADAVLANNEVTATTTVVAPPTISVADAATDEGDTGTHALTFRVSLSNPSSQVVTADFATADGTASAGADYWPTNGVITFPPGITEQFLSVQIQGDTVDEADETFYLVLSNPVNAGLGKASATGTIRDDDGPAISITDVTVSEGNSGTTNAVFDVYLSAPSPQTVRVEYATADGSAVAPGDYTGKSGTLIFAAGLTNRTIAVPVRGDILIESDETFFVNLFNPQAATVAKLRGVGVIRNDDGLPGQLDHFGWSGVGATQYVGQPFTATLTALDHQDNPATNFNGRVNLSARVETQPAQIGHQTTVWEYPMGTFYHDSRIQSIYLAGEVGPARWLTGLGLYVVDLPGQTLNRWTIRLKHTALSQYEYDLGATFERTGWTTAYQHNETIFTSGWVYFEFTTPFYYDGTNNLMVDLSFNNSSYTVDGTCRYSITDEYRSIYACADSDFGDPLNWYDAPLPWPGHELPNIKLVSKPPVAIEPTTADLVAGGWSGPLSFLEGATNVVLRAQDSLGHAGSVAVATVVALNDLSVSVTDAPDPVTVGQELIYTITVNNTGPDPATGVVLSNSLPAGAAFVSAAVSQGACTNLEAVVMCELGTLAGGAQATAQITVCPSLLGTLTNTVTVTRLEADATLLNNRAVAVTKVNSIPRVSIGDAAVAEGDSDATEMVFQVTLSVPSSHAVTVDYATADGTAKAGSDYVATNGVVSFPAGSTSQSLSVLVLGDTLDETDETFVVRLSNPLNATMGDSSGLGRIYDDDGPSITISDVTVTERGSGTTNAVFQVQLSAPSPQVITVDYETVDGSAVAPDDYYAKSGTLSFSVGATNRTIMVAVRSDALVEDDETFFMALYNESGATLAKDIGQCTIVDYTPPGVLKRFAWEPVASPQEAGVAFPVTITALDAFGQVVPTFANQVNLSGQAGSGTIGSGALIWEFPLNAWWQDCRLQSIYLASELGGARQISSLALCVAAMPSGTLNRWTIRMKHTALSRYGDNPAWENSGWTVVYQADEDITSMGWVTFNFDTPFAYNGTDNLLIDFSFNNDSWNDGAICLSSITEDIRSISYESDSMDGDPLDWSGDSPTPNTANRIVNVRLGGVAPVPVAPVVSGLFTNGVWAGSLTVETEGTHVVLQADDGQGHLGLSNPFAVLPPPKEIYRLVWDTIPAEQQANVPFPVALTAMDAFGQIAANFSGAVGFSGRTADGAVAVSPTLSGSFTNGVWAGSLAVEAPATNVVLQADDGQGHTGLSNPFAVLGPIDSDGDLMPDDWELANGLNPRDPSDAALDSDGDGLTNLQEFLAGTDPRDPASVLRITAIHQIPGAETVIRFTTRPGKQYTIEFTDALGGVWQQVSSQLTGTGSEVEVSDPAEPNAPQRFYRVTVR
jgi:uncharacterized repeat protein (TIGR01451 family)